MPVRHRSAENTLALSDSGTYIQNIIESGTSDQLTLLQTVAINIHIVDASNTLDLAHSVIVPILVFDSSSSVLSLTQSALATGALNKSLSNSLNLTQTAESEIKAGIVSNQLTFIQSVSAGQPISLVATSSLLIGGNNIDIDDLLAADLTDPESVPELFNDTGLRDSVGVTTILNIPVTSYLSLSHFANDIPIQTPSSHLQLSHTAVPIEHELVESRLLFSQLATGVVSYDATNALTLTQTVVPGTVYSLTVSQTLNIRQVCSFYTVDLCNYNPGVGEGPFGIPPAILPLVRRDTTVLTYPFDSPTHTVTLRNPNFDNVEQYEPRRVNRRTRGGTLDVFRDESWPKTKRLIYTFSSLKEQDIEDMIDFLEQSLGKEIGLLDFESRQWKGIILTPSAAFGEGGINKFQASLEFEGEQYNPSRFVAAVDTSVVTVADLTEF